MMRWCSSSVIWEGNMNSKLEGIARRYSATLRRYLSKERETVLEQAYELGRTAIAQGFGILDMARVHQEAMGKLMCAPMAAERNGHLLQAAESFLLQSLSPFEATHRGFRETNVKLQQRNRELEAEIKQRQRVEDALRQSENHYCQVFNEAQAMQENLRDLSNEILRTQEEE